MCKKKHDCKVILLNKCRSNILYNKIVLHICLIDTFIFPVFVVATCENDLWYLKKNWIAAKSALHSFGTERA